MLLKRLKERVNGYELGKLQCIATSATLGGGKEDFPKVADFASELFSENFYPEDINSFFVGASPLFCFLYDSNALL